MVKTFATLVYGPLDGTTLPLFGGSEAGSSLKLKVGKKEVVYIQKSASVRHESKEPNLFRAGYIFQETESV